MRTFLAIQRIFTACPFRSLQMRMGGWSGSPSADKDCSADPRAHNHARERTFPNRMSEVLYALR